MRNRDGQPRRWAALLGVALLTGCYSPSDVDRIYGYVGSQGGIAIEPAYLDARAFSEGLAAVRVAGCWGYVDLRQLGQHDGSCDGHGCTCHRA